MHQVANKHSSLATGDTSYTTVKVPLFSTVSLVLEQVDLLLIWRLITAISLEQSMLALEKVRHSKHIPVNQN